MQQAARLHKNIFPHSNSRHLSSRYVWKSVNVHKNTYTGKKRAENVDVLVCLFPPFFDYQLSTCRTLELQILRITYSLSFMLLHSGLGRNLYNLSEVNICISKNSSLDADVQSSSMFLCFTLTCYRHLPLIRFSNSTIMIFNRNKKPLNIETFIPPSPKGTCSLGKRNFLLPK